MRISPLGRRRAGRRRELYDLQTDPLEETNLAAKKDHQKTLAGLRKRWKKLRKELE